MRKRAVLLGIAVLLMGIVHTTLAEDVDRGAAPAADHQAAGSAGGAACTPAAGGAQEASAAFTAPIFELARPGSGGGSWLATCIADCTEGPDQVCWGSYCYAYDQSCPSQRGRCYGTSTGTKYCAKCPDPPCSAYASCAGAGGGSVSCNGTNGDCYAIDNCYAYCNGQYHMCPNPPGPCPF